MTQDENREQGASVADVLRELRRAKGITQEAVARRLDMTLSGYRTYEQGKRQLRVEQLPRFAQALGVPVSEITRRLWPDRPAVERLHFSAEWDELQQQTANLPPELREMVLRAYRQSLEIANGASDLARRN